MTKVLDYGKVELVEVMGNDRAIVDAARVSISGQDVKPTLEDRNLIRYLLRHQHTTPFEMVEFKFNCKMPIFVARQWIRHRTASVNEMSARYSVMPNEFYVPDLNRMQEQSKNNKQGSGDLLPLETRQEMQEAIAAFSEVSYATYEKLLEKGCAREIARMVLPTNIYTQWFWKMDLHNLMHFLKLRLHPHAQYEIRVFAEAIAAMVKEQCPIAWEAFEDYKLGAENFSRQELAEVREMARVGFDDTMLINLGKREKLEFMAKIGADC